MTHDIRNDTGRNRYILTVDGEEAGYLSATSPSPAPSTSSTRRSPIPTPGRVWPANWPATPSATSATAGSTP